MLDSVIPHQAPADSKVPFGKFSPSFPGQVADGTEDAKVVAIPNPGLRPLICSYSFKGGGIVAALHLLEFQENASCMIFN